MSRTGKRTVGVLLLTTAALTCASPGAAAPTKQARPIGALRLLLLDADGGAAALFVTPEGRSLLVDTGWPIDMAPPRPPADGSPTPPRPAPTVNRILNGMKQLGITKIDYLLTTHYHFDHVGGIHDLIAQVPVGTFVDHGPNREPLPAQQATVGAQQAAPSPNAAANLYTRYEQALAGRKRLSVKAGQSLMIGSMKMTFVASDGQLITRPLTGKPAPNPACGIPDTNRAPDENNRSIGFVATFGKARILDLADLTWNEEKRLVCPVNTLGPIDLLLVSHHGSELSNTPPLFEAIRPRVALVGNGARKGGDKSVFDRLQAASSKPAIWYQHLATRNPEANPAPERIANLTLQPDGGYMIDVRIERNGAMRVRNARTGRSEDYGPR